MRINAHDLIEVGTAVIVQNERGIVTKAEMVPASNGGMIALHTVKLVERWKRTFADRGRWEPKEKPVERTVNYSFIEVED